jgi:chromosome segregation ATPase
VGGSLSTVSKYWKVWRDKEGYNRIARPKTVNPSNEINTIFKAELNNKINAIHEEYEIKFNELEKESEYLRITLVKSEQKIRELEDYNTSTRDRLSYVEGVKASQGAQINELKQNLDYCQIALKQALADKSWLEGYLKEISETLNHRLSELTSMVKPETSSKNNEIQ